MRNQYKELIIFNVLHFVRSLRIPAYALHLQPISGWSGSISSAREPHAAGGYRTEQRKANP